ncbi:Vid27 family [Fusarium albosuccineum]|uniref:Vid27 family n=1 Tax=Fusarium albosuccineum TaxID=1237068 RepID=A0A8H4KRQ4_9HYPO|nr:Vid27 family [Fusarium albosuccineum]
MRTGIDPSKLCCMNTWCTEPSLTTDSFTPEATLHSEDEDRDLITWAGLAPPNSTAWIGGGEGGEGRQRTAISSCGTRLTPPNSACRMDLEYGKFRQCTASPKKVMLHKEDRDLIMQNMVDPAKLFRMDIEYGKVVDEWVRVSSCCNLYSRKRR